MIPLGNVIRQDGINLHCYADDTQLYLSMKPDETNRLVRLQACLKGKLCFFKPRPYFLFEIRLFTHREQFGEDRRPLRAI